jgi:hypothetical protein
MQLRGHHVDAGNYEWTWRGCADLVSDVRRACREGAGRRAPCFLHGGSILRGEVFGIGRGDVGTQSWGDRGADRRRAPLPNGRARSSDSGRPLVPRVKMAHRRTWFVPKKSNGTASPGRSLATAPRWSLPVEAVYRDQFHQSAGIVATHHPIRPGSIPPTGQTTPSRADRR